MSDNQDSQNNDIPTQEPAANNNNQDTKISYDPNISEPPKKRALL